MAKRFTDSEKWKKFWFRKLKPEHKLFWIYILDNCDCAGVWETDFEIAEQFIGKKLNIKEVEKDFDDQILKIENNKWFIIDFIEFQYKKTVYELDPDNNAHKKAIFIVNKYDIKNKLKTKHSAPHISPSAGGGKDKEEEKEVDKEKESEKIKIPFSDFYEAYGKKVGDRSKLEKKWERLTETERKAIMDYIPKYKLSQPDKQYRKNPETFLNNRGWEDELIYSDDKFRNTEKIEKEKPDYEKIANELVVKHLAELKKRKQQNAEYDPIDEAEYLVKTYIPNARIVCPSIDFILERYIKHYLVPT